MIRTGTIEYQLGKHYIYYLFVNCSRWETKRAPACKIML